MENFGISSSMLSPFCDDLSEFYSQGCEIPPVEELNCDLYLPAYNLVPRSHSVTGNARSGKVRFRACSEPARPEIRAFLSLRVFVLSVVILGDFAE